MKFVHGVGINDAGYNIRTIVGGVAVNCPFYRTWSEMLCRCYSGYPRYRTYEGVTVCNEWLTFSNFRGWMEQQDWEGKQLDKDILGGDTYSPDTCVFITGELNKALLLSNGSRGAYPLGVHFHIAKDRYHATIKRDNKTVHLGYFATAKEAHVAWQKAKIESLRALLPALSDDRVHKAISDRIVAIQSSLAMRVETVRI